jgi:hypothetical protein
VNDLRGILEAAFGLRLVAEYAERKINDVETSKRVDAVREQIGVMLGPVKVGNCGIDVASAARARIRGDSRKPPPVTRYKEEMIAAIRPEMNARLGNA